MPAIAPSSPIDPMRYRVDVAAAVARPAQPTRWVVEPLVAAGTLTTLVAKTATGKTFVAHAAADAVARGATTGGLRGTRGTAVMIDAEMGEQLTIDRFRAQGYSTDIALYCVTGVDLATPNGQALFLRILEVERPAFVAIDSLRRIAPSAKENDSDSMGGVVSFLADQAHKKDGPAILLLHHEGHTTGRSRGTIAIMDQSDAVWAMRPAEPLAAEGSPESEVRRLSATGADAKPPRYTRPPAPVFVRIPRDTGGLVAADAPPPKVSPAEWQQRIVDVLPQPSAAAAARALGMESRNNAFNRPWQDMRNVGVIHQVDGAWVLNPEHGPVRAEEVPL